MFTISEFLKKFKNLNLDKESQKKEVIKTLLEFSIPVEDVVISNNKVKVKASSVAKNQIFIKKKQILEKLHKIEDIS